MSASTGAAGSDETSLKGPTLPLPDLYAMRAGNEGEGGILGVSNPALHEIGIPLSLAILTLRHRRMPGRTPPPWPIRSSCCPPVGRVAAGGARHRGNRHRVAGGDLGEWPSAPKIPTLASLSLIVGVLISFTPHQPGRVPPCEWGRWLGHERRRR